MKKILIKNEIGGVPFHRVINPVSMILQLQSENKIEQDFCFIKSNQLDFSTLEKFIETTQGVEYDAVFFTTLFHRNINNQTLIPISIENKAFMEYFKSKGIKIIVDIDDYWFIEDKHPLQDLQNIVLSKEVITCMRNADMVFTTTDLLADKIKIHNPNVHVLPNVVRSQIEPQFQLEKTQRDYTNFGFLGSSLHYYDLLELKKTLPKVNYAFSGYTKFDSFCKKIESLFTFGFTTPESQKLLENTDQTDFSIPNYQRIGYKNPFEYGQSYKEIDVLLIPLRDTNFNSSKSPLKLAEAGATNTAVIVSNVEPYKKYLKHGVNCLKVTNQSDWGKFIKELDGNKQRIKDLVEGLKETCEEHFNWVKVSKQRADLFRQILN